MEIKQEIQTVLDEINTYTFHPNLDYLYPLRYFIKKLRDCFSLTTDNSEFNKYINKHLLPSSDYYYVDIFEDVRRTKRYAEDAQIIKDGCKYWTGMFQEAIKYYSI